MPLPLDRPGKRPIVPFSHRIVAALFLRPDLYAYAATDPAALSQGIAVVCFTGMVQPSVLTRELGAWGMLISLVLGLMRWLLFVAAIAYPTARLLAPEPVVFRRLLSCLGFAEAPAFLNALAFMTEEPLPAWLRAGIWLWLLAANVVAVRAAVGASLRRAAVIALISFGAYLGVGLATGILLPT